MSTRNRLADYVLVFAVGCFGLVAQTLLFRDFLTVYEGNELGMVSFFCSWLLWVAAGAMAARREGPVVRLLGRHFSLVPLLYVPAYLLQAWLIRTSRELAGVATYETFAFMRMLPVSLIANAPVSFCTGFLFTLACRWFSDTHVVAVARVYVVESAGSFAGGLLATLLLARNATAEFAFLLTAAFLIAAVGLQRLSRAARLSGIALLALSPAILATRMDRAWTRHNDVGKWQRLFSGDTYEGSFATPQARYLYGERQGQFIVMAWESVAESIPSAESASQVIAVHLAQQPAAKRFLVIGHGSYAICRRLLDLPQLEAVTWLDPDPDYARCLLGVLPQRFKTADARLEAPGEDVRAYLRRNRVRYDVAIVNLPDVASLALNRYFTREFFTLLKRHVTPAGIVGVRISGAENFMGDELSNAGASVFETLGSLFRGLVIKPGDESWLIASDGGQLSEKPALLRDRFRNVEGAAGIYPPEGLMSLYLPDRADYQRSFYVKAVERVPRRLMLNTDRQPKALLYSLLFAARQTGATVAPARWVRNFALGGLSIVLCAIGLYAALRFLYLVRGSTMRGSGATPGIVPPFDRSFLVFSTGAVSMSTSILLMYMYQSVFGSIFLHIGLVSALFMLGLSIGSLASEQALIRNVRTTSWLLPAGIVLHILFLLLLCTLRADLSRACFGVLFLAAGLLSGTYVPVAAMGLKQAGVPDRAAGAAVDFGDHLGGALGGLMAGLILLPLLGGQAALVVLALLLAANLPALIPCARQRPAGDGRERLEALIRPAGYILAGLAAFLLFASVTMQRTGADSIDRLLAGAVRSLAPDAEFVCRTQTLPDGKSLVYFVHEDAAKAVRAYGFSTDQLAPGVVGYAGPIVLAVLADEHGVIQGLRVIRSNETPAYLESLEGWWNRLRGRPLFRQDALADVDAVTGATLTSRAILGILRQSGQGFASSALGLAAGPKVAEAQPGHSDRSSLFLILLLAIALALRARPHRGVRRLVLLAGVIIGGYRLNLQYSLAHVLSLAGWSPPPAGLNAAFLLVVIVPACVLLLGNFYCGYLCPFGALQELIGDLRPARLKTVPGREIWRWTRRVKYALLLIVVLLYAVTLDPGLASSDPLVTIFSKVRGTAVVLLVLFVLLLSFFFDRFWCRALCPAGAALSLLNGVRALRRFSPKIAPALCPYGVVSDRDLDCIACDRCRRLREEDARDLRIRMAARMGRETRLVYLAAVCAAALFLLQEAVSTCQLHRLAAATRPAAMGAAGQVRNVNLPKLEEMIRQRRLSDREAMYWKPWPTDEEKRPSAAAP